MNDDTPNQTHRPDPATWVLTVVTDELVHLNAACACGDDNCCWAIDTYDQDFIYYTNGPH
jgi:hypothetical protein